MVLRIILNRKHAGCQYGIFVIQQLCNFPQRLFEVHYIKLRNLRYKNYISFNPVLLKTLFHKTNKQQQYIYTHRFSFTGHSKVTIHGDCRRFSNQQKSNLNIGGKKSFLCFANDFLLSFVNTFSFQTFFFLFC